MRISTLALQATLVVGVTATVGYPEFREPVRPVTIWRTSGPLTPRPDLVASDQRFAFGLDSASSEAARSEQRRLESGLRTDTTNAARFDTRAGNTGSRSRTISGNARTSLNQAVPFATVVLRNIRTGRIEGRVRADQNGRFEFDVFNTSGYVIEMVGTNGAVIAASEMMTGASNQATVLRVSANATPRALFGTVTTTSAATTGGTTTGTSTGTTTSASSDASNPFVQSTAGEPIGRAVDEGVGQTTEPDEDASPRN